MKAFEEFEQKYEREYKDEAERVRNEVGMRWGERKNNELKNVRAFGN